MKIEFDPAKNVRNIAELGISFERADEFEWETAVVIRDTRRDYRAMVITPRSGGIRVISLRKANRREERQYAEETSKP